MTAVCTELEDQRLHRAIHRVVVPERACQCGAISGIRWLPDERRLRAGQIQEIPL